MSNLSSVILVSLNNYDLPDIKCVKSFENIDWSGVGCLIFHSSSDSELMLSLKLSEIKDKVEKVIYINKNISPLFYCFFTGLDADIYDIEDYLMDQEMIKFLIDNYKNTSMTVRTPSSDMETLAKNIATLSSSSFDNIQKIISHKYWIQTLNTAVSNVDTALSRAAQVNIDIMDMLQETAKLINTMEAGNETTSKELMKLKELIMEMEKKSRPNSAFMFSTYNVPVSVSKVLYIKAVGNCKYLNSFILAYQHYLKMEKQYSSKVLIILPKMKYILKRYENIPRLGIDSIDFIDVRSNNLYVTYEPKHVVMDTFFSQENIGVYIVLDLTLGETLVKGHMVETLYAANGVSDLDRYNIPPERTIISIYRTKGCITIKHLPKYNSANEATRRAMYYQYCKEDFELLDKFAIKERR